jgi:hypothetical protein
MAGRDEDAHISVGITSSFEARGHAGGGEGAIAGGQSGVGFWEFFLVVAKAEKGGIGGLDGGRNTQDGEG